MPDRLPLSDDLDDRTGCLPDDDLPAGDEWADGADWYGDPWYFDVKCSNCGYEYVNTTEFCPGCGTNEKEAVAIE